MFPTHCLSYILTRRGPRVLALASLSQLDVWNVDGLVLEAVFIQR